MSNIKISQLPTYTGSIAGTWFVIDNPTLTETFKIVRENIVGSSGTSGSSGFNGANGTSGSSGTSGSDGSSGIAGSSGTSGSSGISGSSGSSGLGISTKAGSSDGTGWTYDNVNNQHYKTITFSSPFGSTNYTVNAVFATGGSDSFSVVRTGFSGATTNGFVAIVGSPVGSPPTNYQYTATAFQETGVPGTSGTSGSSGTSGIIADSIFAQTGSVWNTTNNIGITGSLTVSGTGNTQSKIYTSGGNNELLLQSTDLGASTLRMINISGSISNRMLFTQTKDEFTIDDGASFIFKSISGGTPQFTRGLGITGSLIASGSAHTIRGNTSITGSLAVTGSLITTGSISGNHLFVSIVSSTASLNLNNGTFFTVTLPGTVSTSTHILPTNVREGQTINILINGTSATLPDVTFPSYVKQVSGSAYTAASNAIDIVTLISFTSSSLYLGSIKNYI